MKLSLIVRPIPLFLGPEPPRGIETRCHVRQAAAVAMKLKQMVVHRDGWPEVEASLKQCQRRIVATLQLPTDCQASEQQGVLRVLLLSGLQKRDCLVQFTQREMECSQIHARVEREVIDC